MYVICSVSDEGTFYLVKNRRKNKALWTKWINDYTLFKSEASAKGTLTKLLKEMDEYKSDLFYLLKVNEFGEVIMKYKIYIK